MTPDISEFSYGFALTQELVTLANRPLRAAPVFPSLIQEGSAGGGYDVHLDLPGFPLFLQFKRADCMIRSYARELVAGLPLSQPFYRFRITERSRSRQHDLLLALDTGANQVFYAVPRFHRLEELDEAYLSRRVVERSFFIRPSEIGSLDDNPHHISFDTTQHYLLSEPREIPVISGEQFPIELERRFSSDARALRDGPLTESLSLTKDALHKNSIRERRLDFGRDYPTEHAQQLEILADLALRYFGAQLFIVQQRETIPS